MFRELLKRKPSFLLTRTKLRVPGPRLPEQPVPAADGRDGVLHRVRGRAVQRGGAAAAALRRPQRRREVVSPPRRARAAPVARREPRGVLVGTSRRRGKSEALSRVVWGGRQLPCRPGRRVSSPSL